MWRSLPCRVRDYFFAGVTVVVGVEAGAFSVFAGVVAGALSVFAGPFSVGFTEPSPGFTASVFAGAFASVLV